MSEVPLYLPDYSPPLTPAKKALTSEREGARSALDDAPPPPRQIGRGGWILYCVPGYAC
ncbi:hypothetical protein T484DRAFT_2517402 [Baffinella frigidus]|nr:hypothetical protein T484DRAFT_2517402 [Cryptophyta sp. CCMP2293]